MIYKSYENYVDSNIEWIGKIPEHWKITPLKRFTKLHNGKEINVEVEKDDKNSIGVYGSGGLFKYTNEYLFNGESVLFGRKGTLGKPIYLNKRFWTVDTMYYLSFNMHLLPKYCYYYLTIYPWNKISTETAKPSVVGNDLIISLFAIPDMDEQKQIANYLDKKTGKIDETISKNKQLIDLLKEKRTALINQVVTKGLNPEAPMKDSEIEWIGEIPEHWDVRKLKYLTSKIGSGKTPKGGSEIYVSEGIPLLRSQNIHFDSVRWDDVVYITNEINKTMWSTIVKNHDVLLNITGASIGRCNYIEDIDIANVNQHVCIIRPNKTIFYKYLNYFLQSECGQNQVFLNQNGTSREGLNFEDLSNFDIILPDYEEQIKIVSFIDNEIKKIYSTISKINDSITLLEEYKTSLIHHVVTGKIDVRGEEI